MIKPIFGIYDVKGGYYKYFFAMKTRGEALRGFTTQANDKQTEIGQYPEDFAIFYLADFDEEKGTFENQKAPVSLGLAQDFVNK